MIVPSPVNFRVLQRVRIDTQKPINMIVWFAKVNQFEAQTEQLNALVNSPFSCCSTKLTWAMI